MSIKNIVVAVDGSEVSQEALNQAVLLAKNSKANLKGFFVVDSQWPDYIGNDWQSSKGSRQTFLDYIHEEQESQARSAQEQFVKAAKNLKKAHFELLTGDPTEVVIGFAIDSSIDLLVLSKRVFQVSGRPSLKALGKKLLTKSSQPILVFP